MRKTKRYKELEKQDEEAFKNFLKYLNGNQVHLFQEHLTARHLFEQERIRSIFEK